MKFLSLAWNINKLEKRIGGNTVVFDWSLIEKKLVDVIENSGTLTIDAEDDDESPRMLQVRSENGFFLVTLGMEASDGWVVKSYRNLYDGNEKIEILGDLWNKNSICSDKNIVIDIFSVFYREERVSECLS
jgi:hypothetical protein